MIHLWMTIYEVRGREDEQRVIALRIRPDSARDSSTERLISRVFLFSLFFGHESAESLL